MENESIKSKRREYYKNTKNPYTYDKYRLMYPNIKVKRCLNFKSLTKEQQSSHNKILRDRTKFRKLNMQKIIDQKRKELWIIFDNNLIWQNTLMNSSLNEI